MDHARFIVQHADERRSYVTRQIAGETLIVPVTGHVMDLEAIYVLNPVASRIWELLRSPTTSERIAAAIASEFDVSVQTATDDVLEFVESLRSRGLVADAPASA
ncbi:MAG TPA: PqqD family protein [Vicinamibacterales bacterium]|nr:PqqD family protein [Vicinamibacterales bacterium]